MFVPMGEDGVGHMADTISNLPADNGGRVMGNHANSKQHERLRLGCIGMGRTTHERYFLYPNGRIFT